MQSSVEYHLNKATIPVIIEHLLQCDDEFIPPLSQRVKIDDYAIKMATKAMRFEAWSDNKLVGFVAVYCNDQEAGIGFITTVSVLKARTGEGIATNLLWQCIEHAKASGMEQICLEVAFNNTAAIKLYEKVGFVMGELKAQLVAMQLHLNSGEAHE